MKKRRLWNLEQGRRPVPKTSAAQTLDNVSRAALIAQAKRILTEAANSLGS
jgi:hypothetical protein